MPTNAKSKKKPKVPAAHKKLKDFPELAKIITLVNNANECFVQAGNEADALKIELRIAIAEADGNRKLQAELMDAYGEVDKLAKEAKRLSGASIC